jgi:hypothetical protein
MYFNDLQIILLIVKLPKLNNSWTENRWCPKIKIKIFTTQNNIMVFHSIKAKASAVCMCELVCTQYCCVQRECTMLHKIEAVRCGASDRLKGMFYEWSFWYVAHVECEYPFTACVTIRAEVYISEGMVLRERRGSYWRGANESPTKD